jgi:hypothetical protein
MIDAPDWQRMARGLRDLHRALLERARRDYERERGSLVNPAQLLQLLATDPYFHWLRALSELMVDIDMVRDGEPALMAELTSAVRPAVERLISAAKTPADAGSFSQYYLRYVQDDPQVAMAHAGIKQIIGSWPLPEETDEAALLHERHRLAEKARHRKG